MTGCSNHFSTRSAGSAPRRPTKRLEAAGDHPEAVQTLGIEWTLTQIPDLIAWVRPLDTAES
jgi:hypothetical protein